MKSETCLDFFHFFNWAIGSFDWKISKAKLALFELKRIKLAYLPKVETQEHLPLSPAPLQTLVANKGVSSLKGIVSFSGVFFNNNSLIYGTCFLIKFTCIQRVLASYPWTTVTTTSKRDKKAKSIFSFWSSAFFIYSEPTTWSLRMCYNWFRFFCLLSRNSWSR